MKKTLSTSLFFLLLGNTLSAQTAIFEYDEAGNQVLRGLCSGCKSGSKTSIPVEPKAQTILEEVSKSIRVAPVPVKTNLTVLWDIKVKDYIKRIELVPYNDVRILSFFEVKNTSNTSCIFNMESYSYGVYYLRFYLSDGSIFTKTITKN
ncbi:hypothetical protein CHRY9390_00983 [Chryseobacterium aquaeductus]|uniref:Secretion system C-terminal sorting domain-containing protein n=1 Tax=Chryseobacterium aquaeductus TaxID=2675056 RepID=A0A9N8MGL5_9FLAO|nr:hypothetical protein [Chryseobacterium aquaeductus]CAA7330321.1 hypothetical protein CHRY9390_00983 [Chryseobacterium potabilaquae]CAD7802819.1 hypothetical protein CHRY9390_00983 [Chryseobacterium aquaeductus]